MKLLILFYFFHFRILSYYNVGTENNIIDPTPEKKWLYKKASILKLKIVVPKQSNLQFVGKCPGEFQADLQNLNSPDGWSKTLENLPNLTVEKIMAYVERINRSCNAKSTKIKKHFQRGHQLLEENFVDLNSIYSKQNESFFSIKGTCAASLKQKDRWVFIVIKKSSGDIEFAKCQCPAGKAGTCSHSYAILKIVAKWVIDGLTLIPQQKACTAKPCIWSVPQSRGRIEKHNINDLKIKSPPSKKAKCNETSTKTKQGITSTLYVADAGRRQNDCNKISVLVDSLKESNPTLHFLDIVNSNCEKKCETKFGVVPEGSVLAVQMSLLPPNFKVYTSNIPPNDNSSSNTSKKYPRYPFTPTEAKIKTFVDNISDIKKLKLLESLKVDNNTVNFIENQTKEQADCPEWFDHRKNRFTASLCNKLKSIKTERGLSTLANNLVFDGQNKNKNFILERKMNHGKYYEPIAISNYEKYFKSNGYDIEVEPCGLVIDEKNYILGATPDGKVTFNGSYGILEVKCSEEYKNVDPKDVCYISKNPCIKYRKNTGKITICKSHSYYDQIQMQLALTCQTFCDFIFYTNKGMVIDRVNFDKSSWDEISERVLKFYFGNLLEKFLLKEEKEVEKQLFNDDIPLVYE